MVAATTLVLLLAAPAVAAMPAHSFSSSYAAQLATLKAQHPELREFNASAASTIVCDQRGLSGSAVTADSMSAYMAS